MDNKKDILIVHDDHEGDSILTVISSERPQWISDGPEAKPIYTMKPVHENCAAEFTAYCDEPFTEDDIKKLFESEDGE